MISCIFWWYVLVIHEFLSSYIHEFWAQIPDLRPKFSIFWQNMPEILYFLRFIARFPHFLAQLGDLRPIFVDLASWILSSKCSKFEILRPKFSDFGLNSLKIAQNMLKIPDFELKWGKINVISWVLYVKKCPKFDNLGLISSIFGQNMLKIKRFWANWGHFSRPCIMKWGPEIPDLSLKCPKLCQFGANFWDFSPHRGYFFDEIKK